MCGLTFEIPSQGNCTMMRVSTTWYFMLRYVCSSPGVNASDLRRRWMKRGGRCETDGLLPRVGSSFRGISSVTFESRLRRRGCIVTRSNVWDDRWGIVVIG